jgi:hypothetical protein
LRRRLGVAAEVGAPKASCSIVRTRSETVMLHMRSPMNVRTSLTCDQLPVVLLDRLFVRVERCRRALLQLPDKPGRLSAQFAAAIGRFWSEELRAHVIPAVAAPEGAIRPLVVEEARASAPDGRNAAKRTTVRVQLSPSSAECACAMHGVRLHHGERSAESNVALELSMCGRPLNGPHGRCSLHLEQTPAVGDASAALRGVCCFGTQATIVCRHRTQGSGTHRAPLCHSAIPLTGANLLHARTLIACGGAALRAIDPLIGKTAPSAFVEACTAQHTALERAMDAVHRARIAEPKHSDLELAHRDALATDLLRAGGLFQHQKPDGSPTLARRNEGGRCVPCARGPEAALAATHGHLFPTAHVAKRVAKQAAYQS